MSFSTRSRTGLAALAAAALVATSLAVTASAASASPAAPLDANELAAGVYTSDVVAGDFIITATADRAVEVDSHSRTADDGATYTQRLKLNGAGSADFRSLQFYAAADAEVTVHVRSANGTEDRALALYDESFTEVDRVDAVADVGGVPIATQTLTIPAEGTYFLSSPSSGVNIYYAAVGGGDDVERAPWADVAPPTVDEVVVDPSDPARLLVTYTGRVGVDGADIARAALYDADGEVVDQAIAATAGPGGTIALRPPGSGDYAVDVQLTRSGEDQALTSELVAVDGFVLPLGAPSISGVLTSAVSGTEGTLTVEWAAVLEAESYAVQLRQDGADFATVDTVTGTSAAVPGLAVGETYDLRVVAQRGGDATPSAVVSAPVAAEVERWQAADVGSNAGSGGQIIENADGTITFDAVASSTKFASSEDGFQYYFTAIDPTEENFTLTATFHVDDAAQKDNQSGFGVIALDDLVVESSPHRYFNSAGALVTRYGAAPDFVNGTPGARFVHGYTGATNDNTAGARDQDSDSVEFDPEYRVERGSAPKFDTGDVYELTLRKSNTGFHALWHRAGTDDVEVIQYDPDMLLQQDPDTFYVGMAVARKIAVTVTDWELTTVHPDDDEPAQEPPTRYVPTTLGVDVTSTTPGDRLDVPLVANFYGTGQILDAAGDVVVDGLELTPGARQLGTVPLEPGVNTFTARAVPDADQPHLREREQLESFDPVETPVTITARSYGQPGQALRVTPDGTPDGDGTESSPLDIHTAVAFAQPGQQIVLDGGTYRPTSAVRIERGRDGEPDAPITLMSAPGERAVLELDGSDGGGIILRGDWWHVFDLEVTGSRDKEKALHVQGHHNVIERVESHRNGDTGIQISGSESEPFAMWPSHNLVMSSESHNNADAAGNDADGFAAKLAVGEGNVFRYNISHHNIDDGWDLYAKSTTGSIGTVLIEDSVAYDNGWTEDDPERRGGGDGFKLGGESMPGDHLLRNAIAYGNINNGVSSNSGPDPRLENVTAVDNARGIRLETNAATTAYEASGVLSWGGAADALGLKQDDRSMLSDPSNYFSGTAQDASDGRPAAVTADWFVSLDTTLRPRIAADGSVDMQGLLELTDVAPSDTGARFGPNPEPTVIELMPTVEAGGEPVEPGPDQWYPTTVYTGGERVQHEGVVYEARWWTRNQEPGAGVRRGASHVVHRGPWLEVGPAEAAPAVAECGEAWDAAAVYHRGDVVAHDGVNHRAEWWTQGQPPGTDPSGPWSALRACA